MERLSTRTIIVNKVVKEIMKQVKKENRDYFEDVIDFGIKDGEFFIVVENKYGREHTSYITSEAIKILERELNEKSGEEIGEIRKLLKELKG